MSNYVLAVLVLVAALASGVRADETGAPVQFLPPDAGVVAIGSGASSATTDIAPFKLPAPLPSPSPSPSPAPAPEHRGVPMLAAEQKVLLDLERQAQAYTTQAEQFRGIRGAHLVPDVAHGVWEIVPDAPPAK